jgi:hypothetical protein
MGLPEHAAIAMTAKPTSHPAFCLFIPTSDGLTADLPD